MWRSGLFVLGFVFYLGCPATLPIRSNPKETSLVGEKPLSQESAKAQDSAVDASVGRLEGERTGSSEASVERSAERLPDVGAGLWSALRITDIHAHIGTFAGYDLSLTTLLANMKTYGVKMALISNIDGANLPGTTLNLDEVKANLETANTVRKYPGMLRGIAWTRPNDGSPNNIETFLRDSKLPDNKTRIFVAMKFHPNMNQFQADSTKLDPYMKLCEKYNVAAVFHGGGAGENSSPDKIYALARRHPKVPIVLYHMGFSGQHQPSIDVVKKSIQQKDALLYLGTAQANILDVIKAVKEVGSERVMFGTDATYYGKDHYGRYQGMVEQFKQKLSTVEFANVMRENAKRVFQLP